jgi:trigger factor
MQVSVESTGPLERRIRVEVPEEKIASEVQNRLRSLSRTTRIQGFRPGKAPLKVVQKHYGNKVRNEVVGEVVQSSFYEALAREKLRPASNPTISPMDAGQGKGLVYTATFEVYPEVNLAPLDKLKIEKPVCTITDNDVENMIQVIRKQQRRLKPVDRKAQEGDLLVIDFSGQVEGQPFAGGEGSDFQIELGSKRLLPGFEDGLVGANPGDEIILRLKFPDTYYKPELSGKPVEFKVNVKVVNEQVLPELDEELFRSMGVEEGGLEKFKVEVRRNMEREAERALTNRAEVAVLDALFEANSIELPKSLIKNEAVRLREQFKINLQSRGIRTEDLSGAEEDDPFQKQAEKKVTLQLIVADIVKNQQIKVDPSKIRQMIEKIAESYEDPNEVVNWYYSDKQRLVEVEALALEDEVVKWILSRAKVTEQELSFDALMNKGQTAVV